MPSCKYVHKISRIINRYKDTINSNTLLRQKFSKLNTENKNTTLIKDLILAISSLYFTINHKELENTNDSKFILHIIPGLGGDDTDDLANIILHNYYKSFQSLDIEHKLNDKHLCIEFYNVEYFSVISKTENILYKIIRNSPFCNKIQTSFIRVSVSNSNIKYNEQQIVDETSFTYSKASSKGGQHANKTLSTVKALHKSTGVYVKASESRSQSDNKKLATKRIIKKISSLINETEQENKKKQILISGPSGFGGTPNRIVDTNKGKFLRDRVTNIKYHLTDISNINILGLVYDNIMHIMDQ